MTVSDVLELTDTPTPIVVPNFTDVTLVKPVPVTGHGRTTGDRTRPRATPWSTVGVAMNEYRSFDVAAEIPAGFATVTSTTLGSSTLRVARWP